MDHQQQQQQNHRLRTATFGTLLVFMEEFSETSLFGKKEADNKIMKNKKK